jgi:hypothetical protein
MHVRVDVRGIVEQEVEHIVTLMLVGPNDLGIDRDMVCDHGVGDNAFLEAEILRRMAGIDRGEACFELLAIATGMETAIEIIMSEDWSAARALLTRSFAARSVSSRMYVSEVANRVAALISEISPILLSPVLVPQASRQAMRVRGSTGCLT